MSADMLTDTGCPVSLFWDLRLVRLSSHAGTTRSPARTPPNLKRASALNKTLVEGATESPFLLNFIHLI